MDKINWELIISFISLGISIASIFYTFFNRKIDLDIVSTWYDLDTDIAYICFNVVNTSDSSVPLNNVILFKENQIIKDNGFSPEVNFLCNLNSVRYSEPFEEKIYLAPFESISFSYYVQYNEIPNKIVLYSSKRLTFFRKKKSFSTFFIRDHD